MVALLSCGVVDVSSAGNINVKHQVLNDNMMLIFISRFLGNIKAAYDKNPNLVNLLLDDFFKDAIDNCQVRIMISW